MPRVHPSEGGFQHQDWKPVVLEKRTKPVLSGKSGNKPKAAAEPEDGTEMKIPTVSKSLKQAIMNARTAKKWKQSDLANKLNVPIKTIAEYENGKIVPNNGFIRRMEVVLGTQLPRIKK